MLVTIIIYVLLISVAFLLVYSLLEVFLTHKTPFVQTPTQTFKNIKQILDENFNSSFVFYDLGCGTGALLKNLARHFPKSTFIGIENSFFVYLFGRLNILGAGNVSIKFGSFETFNISDGTVFYCWLLPHTLQKAYQKIAALKSSEITLISCDFAVPNVVENQKISTGVKGPFGHTLYVYKFN